MQVNNVKIDKVKNLTVLDFHKDEEDDEMHKSNEGIQLRQVQLNV